MSQQFGAAIPDEDNMDIDIDIDMDADVEPIPEPELEVLLSVPFYRKPHPSHMPLIGRRRV